MRLAKRHIEVVSKMEAAGYVWLSHMSKNAIERFRYKTKNGFKGFIKIEGLTFLTSRVAKSLEAGSKAKGRKRLTAAQQIEALENQLIELEEENYQLKGIDAEAMEAMINE